MYILKSQKDGELYIGYTNDLRRRLLLHNDGKVKSTQTRTPLDLKYYEAYTSKLEARHREWSLKRGGNALAQLKRRIKESLND